MLRVYTVFHHPAPSLGKKKGELGRDRQEVFTPVGGLIGKSLFLYSVDTLILLVGSPLILACYWSICSIVLYVLHT
jgi:hypothetical protein